MEFQKLSTCNVSFFLPFQHHRAARRQLEAEDFAVLNFRPRLAKDRRQLAVWEAERLHGNIQALFLLSSVEAMTSFSSFILRPKA